MNGASVQGDRTNRPTGVGGRPRSLPIDLIALHERETLAVPLSDATFGRASKAISIRGKASRPYSRGQERIEAERGNAGMPAGNSDVDRSCPGNSDVDRCCRRPRANAIRENGY
jgi:hypothetical protein